MEYKVKINCPGFSKNETYETDSSGYIFSNYTKIKVLPRLFPDIFEQIKEPIFVTFDGVEIFDKYSKLYSVRKTDYRLESLILSEADMGFLNASEYYIYLSSKQAAEKWISENTPMFSVKQLNDAIDNSFIDVSNTVISTKNLKKQLGI